LKRSLTHKPRRLTPEELEPRQLLSADMVPLPVEPALQRSSVQEAVVAAFAAQSSDSAALLSESYELVFVDPRGR